MRRSISSAMVFTVLLCAASAYAQNAGFGDIRGTVTDPRNLVVPNVTVEVENVDTGVVLQLHTNHDGIYDTSSIIPGHYKVTFSHNGFDTQERGPITLEAGFVNINAILKVGSVSTDVTVNNTDVTLLETETGEQSTTLTFQTMNELPNYGVSWTNNLVLIPGATGTISGSGVQNPGASISINGVLPGFANTLQDGASVLQAHSFNFPTTVFEDVQEVKISTNAFSAEYGVGGIVMNQITKSGTKSFHGSAYEYIQNDDFNAFPYAFSAGSATKAHLRYNHFGGAIGGPVLPRKLFFYFNYDRIVNISASVGYLNVPSTAFRQGNLANLYGGNGQVIALFNPNSSCPIPGHANARCAFSNNQITTIDPVAAALQNLYPTPNSTIANGNYYYNDVNPTHTNNFFGRADWDISQKNRLFFTGTSQDSPALSGNKGYCPIGCGTSDNGATIYQLTDIWTISPKVVNEARMGFLVGISLTRSQSIGQNYPQKVGLLYAKANELPQINPSGISNVLYPITNYTYHAQNWNPSDAVTLIAGRHILRFGGELLALVDSSGPYGDEGAGTFNFTGAYTEQVPGQSVVFTSAGVATTQQAGYGYADFLLGDVQSWSATNKPRHAAHQYSPQAFIQDDYKIRPNLTLNLGLRYQIQEPWHEIHGYEGSFDPTIQNPPTNVLGAMWFASNGTNGRTNLESAAYNIVLPRAGFAFQPRSSMVLRGGVGLYSYGWSLDAYGNGIGYGLGSTGSESDSTGGVTPVTTLSGPGIDQNGNQLPYVSNNFAVNAYNGQSVTYTNYNMPVSRVLQWNASLGQEITNNLAFNISYVATHGWDENFYHDINQVPEADLLAAPASTPSKTQPFRPYPLFQTVNGYDNNTISNYNALQVLVQKRFVSGFTLNFNYVWSHLLNEFDQGGSGGTAGTQPYQRSFNVRANYGPSNFDVRNAFKGYFVYELPFGHGKRFLNRKGVFDYALGGWRASSTFVLQSGNPFNVTISGANNSYAQSGTWYPNVVSNPLLGTPHNLTQWFNPNAYAIPTSGTFGNEERNGLLTGPGFVGVNASLRKSYPLWRESKFELRIDCQNVLNHPNFGLPSTNFNIAGAGQILSLNGNPRLVQLGGRISF